eukprot:TRINITY_DN12097_c0_g1::TRINITY_DN12097_c0_g1_i1::g.9726::m.9726 TRINITY_DN12097_c0_g1::TRINITY_DN12097_c0_g1_i1::g.9726  ORF type:complete len:236 (-),score=11.63,SOG2/PF10428.4/1 TRINITY_DN12097_c0_g1_i1:41-748(-)
MFVRSQLHHDSIETEPDEACHSPGYISSREDASGCQNDQHLDHAQTLNINERPTSKGSPCDPILAPHPPPLHEQSNSRHSPIRSSTPNQNISCPYPTVSMSPPTLVYHRALPRPDENTRHHDLMRQTNDNERDENLNVLHVPASRSDLTLKFNRVSPEDETPHPLSEGRQLHEFATNPSDNSSQSRSNRNGWHESTQQQLSPTPPPQGSQGNAHDDSGDASLGERISGLHALHFQ